jgi:hypothetical protein
MHNRYIPVYYSFIDVDENTAAYDIPITRHPLVGPRFGDTDNGDTENGDPEIGDTELRGTLKMWTPIWGNGGALIWGDGGDPTTVLPVARSPNDLKK